jgi:hypothetical protein
MNILQLDLKAGKRGGVSNPPAHDAGADHRNIAHINLSIS